MNNYSEFQVNIFSNNRVIRKCQSFRTMLDEDEDDDDARAMTIPPRFFQNSQAKMTSKRYRSAQMTRQFKQASFVETPSKESQSNVRMLYWSLEGYLDFVALHQRSHNLFRRCMHTGLKEGKTDIVVWCLMISCMPFVQVSFVLGKY